MTQAGKTVIAVLLLAALVGTSVAQISRMRVFWNDTSNLRYKNLAGTAKCTTLWANVNKFPVQALTWRQWVRPGAADSAQVRVYYQIADIHDTTANNLWAWRDTVIPHTGQTCISTHTDTAGATDAAGGTSKTFGPAQYYPDPCYHIRFIFDGQTDNSDSTWVGSVEILGQE